MPCKPSANKNLFQHSWSTSRMKMKKLVIHCWNLPFKHSFQSGATECNINVIEENILDGKLDQDTILHLDEFVIGVLNLVYQSKVKNKMFHQLNVNSSRWSRSSNNKFNRWILLLRTHWELTCRWCWEQWEDCWSICSSFLDCWELQCWPNFPPGRNFQQLENNVNKNQWDKCHFSTTSYILVTWFFNLLLWTSVFTKLGSYTK